MHDLRWVKGKRGWCRTETGEHSNVSERKKVPARRSVAEDKAKLNVTSFCSSVCSLLSLVRDRALSRKHFLIWAFACSLQHSVPAGTTSSLLRIHLPQSPGSCQSGSGSPTLKSLPLHPQCTLQILSLFMWPCHEKCLQLLFDTCKMILLTPVYGWWLLNLQLLPCFIRSTRILHYTHSGFFFRTSDFYWFEWQHLNYVTRDLDST